MSSPSVAPSSGFVPPLDEADDDETETRSRSRCAGGEWDPEALEKVALRTASTLALVGQDVDQALQHLVVIDKRLTGIEKTIHSNDEKHTKQIEELKKQLRESDERHAQQMATLEKMVNGRFDELLELLRKGS